MSLSCSRVLKRKLDALPTEAQEWFRAQTRYLERNPIDLEANKIEEEPALRWWEFQAAGGTWRLIFDVESRAPGWVLMSIAKL